MIRLPAALDELRGLRARRYVRVSSEEQGAKYGRDGQERTIAAAIADLGLVEAGPAFVDEQSAWARSETRPALRELVGSSIAGEYDVLVVAYFSRWSRDTELALRLRRELHGAGTVLLFADESFLSSDESQHERFLQEATAAEIFSLRLSRTIRKTLAAKFERYGDQAGSPGLGFRRTPQPAARLEVDPATMPTVVALFERYARGDISYRELAGETGMREGAIRGILTNPLYSGWARRHRGRSDAQLVAAPWRADPPVDDELWARVAAVREARLRHGGSPRPRHAYLLRRLLWCPCGRMVKADTSRQRSGAIAKRYAHEDCPEWPRPNLAARFLDDPIVAQVSALRLDAAALAKAREIAARPLAPDTRDRRAHLERELRRIAASHADRRLTTAAYLAEHERLTTELDALASAAPVERDVDPDATVKALRDFAATWAKATEDGRAALLPFVYRRIVVRRKEFVRVELTDEAKALGMTELLPSTVVLARPARLELTTFRSAT